MVVVAFSVLAVLAYTYVGYPVLIALCARVSPLRIHRDAGFEPTVSAIIPAYNAATYVPDKLDSLLAQDYPADKLEILVCSDASDDGTDDVLASYAERDSRVRPLRLDERSGKPAAVNLMRAEASGDILLMTDIRQPLAPGAVRALVSNLADPNVACVSGNLVLRGSAGAGVYWRYENWIRRSEGSFRSMVGVTGPIYAIRKSDMNELPGGVILDDMWVPMRLRLAGRRIVMEPRAEAYDDAFGDKRELSRKIRTLAGNYQLFALLPRLLIPIANPSWFETFSHKLLRLLSPWMLIALLVSTVAAVAQPHSVPNETVLWALRGLLAGQVVFYGAAMIGSRGGRLTGVARTFVVLNYAAVAGLWRFLRGGQKVTW
jgi:cellulose synthase/poly-beta-1,6-N-acetylglucosamine synthase-like glycosyltransferase